MRKTSIIFALLMAAPAFWTSAGPVSDVKSAATQPSNVENALYTDMADFNFKEQHLDEVMDYFRDTTHITLCVDWAAVQSAGITPKTTVTFASRDQTVHDALAGVLDHLAGHHDPIEFSVIGGVVAISTQTGLETLRDLNKSPVAAGEGPKWLTKHLPMIQFRSNELADVIEYLRDVTSTNIYVDWNALAKVGVKQTNRVTLRLRDTPFDESLKWVLVSAGGSRAVRFFLVGDVVAISTPDGLTTLRQAETDDAALVLSPEMQKLLDRPVKQVQFRPSSYADTIEYFRDVCRANIYVDWTALKKAGIEKETPVTMRLRDVPLKEVLRLGLFDAATTPAMAKIKVADKVITITAE